MKSPLPVPSTGLEEVPRTAVTLSTHRATMLLPSPGSAPRQARRRHPPPDERGPADLSVATRSTAVRCWWRPSKTAATTSAGGGVQGPRESAEGRPGAPVTHWVLSWWRTRDQPECHRLLMSRRVSRFHANQARTGLGPALRSHQQSGGSCATLPSCCWVEDRTSSPASVPGRVRHRSVRPRSPKPDVAPELGPDRLTGVDRAVERHQRAGSGAVGEQPAGQPRALVAGLEVGRTGRELLLPGQVGGDAGGADQRADPGGGGA